MCQAEAGAGGLSFVQVSHKFEFFVAVFVEMGHLSRIFVYCYGMFSLVLFTKSKHVHLCQVFEYRNWKC